MELLIPFWVDHVIDSVHMREPSLKILRGFEGEAEHLLTGVIKTTSIKTGIKFKGTNTGFDNKCKDKLFNRAEDGGLFYNQMLVPKDFLFSEYMLKFYNGDLKELPTGFQKIMYHHKDFQKKKKEAKKSSSKQPGKKKKNSTDTDDADEDADDKDYVPPASKRFLQAGADEEKSRAQATVLAKKVMDSILKSMKDKSGHSSEKAVAKAITEITKMPKATSSVAFATGGKQKTIEVIADLIDTKDINRQYLDETELKERCQWLQPFYNEVREEEQRKANEEKAAGKSYRFFAFENSPYQNPTSVFVF